MSCILLLEQALHAPADDLLRLGDGNFHCTYCFFGAAAYHCLLHSKLTTVDAYTACMYCVVMQFTSRLPVQLCMSHGQDPPHMDRFTDLHASTVEAEFHLDLRS